MLKKLHSKNCLLWKNCSQSVWLEGTTKTDWFTLCYPLTNAPGKEEKIARPLGCKKKKKRKGNGPLINDSNCSKLIEYIIHRHPSPPTTCCHLHQFHSKRHAIWLPSLSTCLLSSTASNSIYETQGTSLVGVRLSSSCVA